MPLGISFRENGVDFNESSSSLPDSNRDQFSDESVVSRTATPSELIADSLVKQFRKVHQIPRTQSDNGTTVQAVFERTMQWKVKQERLLEEKRRQIEDRRRSECTFKPRITKLVRSFSSSRVDENFKYSRSARFYKKEEASKSVDVSVESIVSPHILRELYELSIRNHVGTLKAIPNKQSFLAQFSHADCHLESSDDEMNQSELISKKVVDFNEFLRRQNHNEHLRQERSAELKRAMEPSHNPVLCTHSTRIYQRGRSATKKQNSAHKAESVKMKSLKKVNVELSIKRLTTDAIQRRQSRLNELKLAQERSEMDGVSFAPKLTRYRSQNSNSKVKSSLAQNTLQHFINSYVATKRVKDAKIEQLLHMREKQEHDQCTFRPKITQPPEFINRMSRSLSNVKNQLLI